jgi:hypothetical protein
MDKTITVIAVFPLRESGESAACRAGSVKYFVVNPRGCPSVVTGKLECIRMPQTIVCRGVPSLFLLTGSVLVKNTDRCYIVAVVVEFGRVMQHQNWRLTVPKTLPRGLKTSLQNLCLAALPAREKPIGRTSLLPISARFESESSLVLAALTSAACVGR